MTKLELLIIKWQKELDFIESNLLKCIDENNNDDERFYSGKKIRLVLCIEELKNLPNELKGVSNNEQNKNIYDRVLCTYDKVCTKDITECITCKYSNE